MLALLNLSCPVLRRFMHRLPFPAVSSRSQAGQIWVLRLDGSCTELVTFFNYMQWQFEPECRALPFFAFDADFAMMLPYDRFAYG